jgi:hypothetical protein
MADNKTVIEVEVKGTDAATNSLKNLKKELREAQAAALNGDGKAAKRVAELKDKLDDLNDSTKTLKGSGIERATASFQLLGEGVRNLDFGPIKTGLAGLRTALASTGILLIVQAVGYLISNFDELTKGSGGVAKALKAVGDVVSSVINFFTDLIGLTSESERAFKKQSESIKKFAEDTNKALASTNAEYDRQISVMKANGESTVKLEKAKQLAIMETNAAIIHQLLAYKKAGGELSEEQRKQLVASTEAIKNAQTATTVIDIEENNRRKEAYKKRLEEKKALDEKNKEKEKADAEKAKADAEKAAKDEADRLEKIRIDNENRLKKQHKQENDDLKAQAELNLITFEENADLLLLAKQNKLEIEKNIALENTELTESQKALIIAKYEQDVTKLKEDEANKQKELKKKTEEQNFKITEQGLKSIQNLSDIFFLAQSSKAKKGSAEAEKLAKKQFQVNKALQLSLAVMDGYKAITASLAASPVVIGAVPNPAGIASLAFAATTSALNVAKILATQYESTSTGGGETPTPSIGSTGETPTITQPMSQQATTPGTNFDAQGNVIGGGAMKAYVVETEITNKQTTVNRLQSQAEFG